MLTVAPSEAPCTAAVTSADPSASEIVFADSTSAIGGGTGSSSVMVRVRAAGTAALPAVTAAAISTVRSPA